MKTKTYLLFLFSFFSIALYAQKSDNSIPKSILFNLNDDSLLEPSKKMLPSLNLNTLLAEDEVDSQNGLPPRFGVPINANYNLNNSGVWKELTNGDKLWRLKIKCENALSINLLYNEFWLPDGAKFHIYSVDKTQKLGGFNSENNRGTYESPGKFTTGLIFGEEIILELYEPLNVAGFSKISIDKVVHGYQELAQLGGGYGQSGPCQVNVNCTEGQNWQDEKKGVALILINGNRMCTGSLINNTANDLTPYFLTADHCIGSLDATGNTDASYYSFYWNYESNNCSNTNNYTPSSTSGATLVANRPFYENGSTDFALFELTESPVDSNIDVHFNGWDRTTSPIQGGVGIHHPMGDFKKISTYVMQPIDGVYYNPPNTHWLTYFIETSNGHSITEPGSSGSPLFQNNGLIIGQLEGGGAENPNCNVPGNDEAEYGRFDVSWNGSSPQRRLKDWLDPSNTNQSSLDGFNPADWSEVLGPETVCSTSTYTFTIDNGTPPYDWNVSSNIDIIQISGNTIEVSAFGNNSNGNGFIEVTYPGSGIPIKKIVWVGYPDAPSGSLNGPTEVITGAMVSYYGGVAPGATSYQWWLPYPFDVANPIDYFSDNWQTLPNIGRHNSSIMTGYGENAGYVQLMGVNECGPGGAIILSVEHAPCEGPDCGDIPIAPPFPNAADTSFTIDLSTQPENSSFYIYIYDMYSNLKYYGESTNEEKTISTVNLLEGIYILHIYDSYGNITSKQLLIDH